MQESIINSDQVGPKASKRKRRKIFSSLLMISLLAGGAYGMFLYAGKETVYTIEKPTTATVTKGNLVSTTEASGTVLLPYQITIVSTENGYVKELLVSEGDVINPEDTLAVLELPDTEDSRDSLEVQLEQAKLELESIDSQYQFDSKALAISLQRLHLQIEEAQKDLAVLQQLASLKSSRETDVTNAQETLQSLQEAYEDTELTQDSKTASYTIAREKQLASIQKLEVDLAIVLEDLEKAHISSPISGEVLSISNDLHITGNRIESGDSLFIVADRSEVYIDFDVYEQYAAFLSVGNTMQVTVGTTTMQAELVKIGKIATLDTDGLSAMITVRAKPLTETILTPGASAVSSITLGTKENCLLLPRGSYLTTGNQKYIFVVQGNTAIRREVVFGNIQGTKVEIISGLEEGDTVLTGSYQNYIDQEIISIE